MRTFRQIIDSWPSLQDYADDLEVRYVTAQLMRYRDSIASTHWQRLVSSAKRRGIKGVTLPTLAAIKAAKERPPRPKQRAHQPAA